MTLNRIRTAFSALVAEDRPGFKQVDASPPQAWITQRRWNA
jgi:hypothetical protein